MTRAKGLRQLVRGRANGRCEYRHLPEALSGASFHVEHVVPFSRGGSALEWNLALACPRCNERKADRTDAEDPHTRERVRLFNPRRNVWSGHFRWSRDRLRIAGRSPIGRATVKALDLNSRSRRQLCRVWRDRLAALFPFE
jgi:hypothetical protein